MRQKPAKPVAIEGTPDPVPGPWDVTDEQYNSDLKWIRAGGINCYRNDGALTYHEEYVLGTGSGSTSRDRIVGLATHIATLQPERLERAVAVATCSLRPTSEKGTLELARFIAQHPGKLILSQDEATQVRGMANAIRTNPRVMELFGRKHLAELAIRWHDRHTGLPCKCRFDWIDLDAPLVIDLKTSKNPGRGFGRDAWTYGYTIAAVHYISGLEALVGRPLLKEMPWRWIAVGKHPPYETHIYKLEGNALAVSIREYRRTMQAMKGCYEFDDWFPPSYGQTEPLRVPGYLLRGE